MGNKILSIGVLVAIVIAITGLFFPQSKSVFGAAVTDVQNSVYSGLSTAQLFVGGSTAGTAVGTIVSTGSCVTGTSTVFAVANPFAATSTVELISLTVTGQATTSTLLVGTSTASTGLSSTSVSPTLANMTISTTTPNFTAGGNLVGSAGYVSPGANTFRAIVVGPSDFVAGQATSTATGSGAAGYTPGLTCSYKLRWTN